MSDPTMRLILVTGGARSGKSAYAERLAAELGGDEVTYIATAERGDAEMARRIARHRADRPTDWTTVEQSRVAAQAVLAAATSVVLLDCMTVLASNVLLDGIEGARPSARGALGVAPDGSAREFEADAERSEAAIAAVRREAELLLDACGSRQGTLIVVTNEVGLGLVPPTALGRWYRDALGQANRLLAEAADEAVLMVSGIPVRLKPARG